MKIFKYLLLLLLLFSFAFTVFVFTKDGRYNFEEKISVNLDKEIVLPYIENNENWINWFDFDFPLNKINISDSSFDWDNQTQKIIKKNLKDSLQFTSVFNDIKNISFLKTRKNKNGTEIIWRGEGHMTFKEKLFYYLPLNINSSFQDKIQNSLKNLKTYLTDRYIKHEVVFEKVELFPEKEVLMLPFLAHTDSLVKNYYMSQKALDSLIFTKSLQKEGEPFIIYGNQSLDGSNSNYSVANAIVKDSIFYASKSKLIKTKPFYAIKVVLKGNYTYKKEVFNKLDQYLESIKHARSSLGFIVEKPIKNTKDNLPENEWVTEFYIPVKPFVEQQTPTATPNVNQNKPRPAQTEEPQRREVIQAVEQIEIPTEKPKTSIEVQD